MPNSDASKNAEVHESNIVHPASTDELPEELKARLQEKMEAVTRAFLDGCIKDRHDRIKLLKDPIINGSAAASTSNAEVTQSKPIYDDSYPQHADYAAMLVGHEKVVNANLKTMDTNIKNMESDLNTALSKIMARFDRLEGKEPSIEDAVEDEYDMPFNSHNDQAYNSCNKGKSVQSETDKTDYTNWKQIVKFAENSDRNQRTDNRQQNTRNSGGSSVLPNPPKSPSRIPDEVSGRNNSSTDMTSAFNRLKEDLNKSLQKNLGVPLRTSRGIYTKPYPPHFDFMRNPLGWKVPDFQKFSGNDNKSTMEHVSMYLAQLGSTEDYMRCHNFPLSLTGTAFSWFTSLPTCTIST